MGSSHTRPKLTQVVPSHSPVDTEEQRISHVTSHWTIEPLQSPPEEQQGCLGMRKNTQLPPLRQEVPLTFSPLTAGSISHSHSTNVGHSIIHSHPPRRLQALQPLTVPVSGILLQGTERRGGAAHHSFTHGQGGHCGTSNFLQGGVLEAQVVLSRQAHSQHRSHRRRIRELQEQRERRRQGRTIFTSSIDKGDDGNGKQRVHLVKRPAERDIFWDVSSEDGLDFRKLSTTSSASLELDRGKTPRTESGNFGFEELALGDLQWGDSGYSHQVRAGTPKSKLNRQATEKRLPWMLGWEGVEHSGVPGMCQRAEKKHLDGEKRCIWPSSTSQGEQIDLGKNQSSKSEQWEFGPHAGKGRRQRGQLTRTKLELIPSFQNQLDLDSDL